MADSILFKEFIEYYPSIDNILDYKRGDEEGSLAFLKDFYTNVWGAFDEYVENDVILYEVFKGNERRLSDIKKQSILLDEMYSTQIYRREKIISIIKDFGSKNNFYNSNCVNDNCKNDNCVNCILKKNLSQKKEHGLRLETSFFSKYFHWYNEVNYSENALPIYDLNVLVGAFIYTKILQLDIKDFNFKRKDFKNIFKIGGSVNNDKALDLEYVGNNCKKKINYLTLKKNLDRIINSSKIENKINDDNSNPKIKSLEIKDKIINLENPTQDPQKNCLYENISIYRLVDKFLWLTYKIAEQLTEAEIMLTEAEKIDENNTKGKNKILNQTVPIKVKLNYLNLLLETKKNTPSDLKNKIINYLNLLKNTSKDQDLLENIEEKIQYLNLLLDTSKDQDLLKKNDKISLQQNKRFNYPPMT